MINQIINFSIKNKLFVGMMTLALIAGGLWSIKKVPLDAVPDITNNQVQVITQAPNLGTEDIEQFITYPVELSMSNLPGVIEIRSISRFGLSVVTVVFEDDMGTYLPRQLVAEKLNDVRQDIPGGFGVPQMGPISTGLGEIYQYTLQVDPEFEGKYSPTDLRTIQDWIIRRQMNMVPGVVEINAFGGDVKQYEVAVNPDQLNALGITISEIFSALENNNQNTGGAYIEKDHYANFIRSEGIARNLSDIENIVVKNINGLPVTVKDVSEVRFGKAVRYGALTMDGKGEAVGGMILMLKGANSNDVIEVVKERMKEIQKSLPEGVHIVPFHDRSALIAKTTGTVTNNLFEGALIVIFVLVFLLGNWRGGLIVASTIPLSLLFAFIMMNVFGVWANLMSLGAIDFGIIIDGAVIIVEGTVFLLAREVSKRTKLSADQRNEITAEASSKMMNSAFFGQLIILIVFIPILALQGIEGKMFQPMALTFMFAMIGVMILCLTYVPMMSALVLRVKKTNRLSWGDRIVHWLENVYDKILQTILKQVVIVMSVTGVMLIAAIFLFTRLGGEFIPQLDEGDLAFHTILKPGSSLSETIETTTKVEQLVMANFPEVEHVISRIGVADVPTDPMPMDVADVIVVLKPPSEWVSADSKTELIEKMKHTIEEVPGVNFEFTQPIEMRFNELMTGVREDVAIKLYGDDLNILADKIEEIAQLIRPIPGIGDLKTEATTGLPQITIRYKRFKLAQYGLQINELNQLVSSAFAGGLAGVIFEGEKRFDLVVRLDEAHRKNIDHLKNLYVKTSGGSQIPLKEVADISYENGPMQISRDNTNRRVYAGINVRGRDVKSLVEEIKTKLDSELELPPGYYIRYGGAFENLERAVDRLRIVVPIALGLIFILIFSALRSFKQSLMIYMAIPLSAIGGVFFLWIRDMPFSISAGIGFIVLFGVAVLNGLVLISGWNELKEDGENDLNKRIRLGAKRRIRPILLTALTDILGFMPMAVSTSAGAEVQQPLATVVIGGMISATFLTLFILPILYRWTENKQNKRTMKIKANPVVIMTVIGAFSFGCLVQAQDDRIFRTENEIVEFGLSNSLVIKNSQLQIEQATYNKGTAFNPDKLALDMQYGQLNSYEKDLAFSLNQQFHFPTVYTSQWNLSKEQIKGAELQLSIDENKLKWEIRTKWNQLQYLHAKEELMKMKDSLLSIFYNAARFKYEIEATNFLEMVTAETELMQTRDQLNLLLSNITVTEQTLSALIKDTLGYQFQYEKFEGRQYVVSSDSGELDQNPMLVYAAQQIEVASARLKVENAKMLPDFRIGYYNQSMLGSTLADGSVANADNRFQVIQAGISVPLFFGSYRSRTKTARIDKELEENKLALYEQQLFAQFTIQIERISAYQNSLSYYETVGLKHAELMISNAKKSQEFGEIGYLEFLKAIEQGLAIQMNYLETVKYYNEAVITLEYLLGK